MTRRVWILGNLTIDDVVMFDGSTTMGLCGGNAIYASLGALRWEPNVGLAARIGPDFPTQHLGSLREAGLELALANVPHSSIHDWALYERDGSRRFVNWLSSGTHLQQSIRPEELPPDIGPAAAVHVAPMPLAVQVELVHALTGRGVATISLDPHEDYLEGHAEELLALLPSVALFLPSRREAELIFGRDDPEAAAVALAQSGCTLVAIKLGAEGSMICAPGESPRHIPAINVRESDPTGCGDAYCGGFLAAWVQGSDAVSAACQATVSASFVAETQGALGVLPIDEGASRDRLARLASLVADRGDTVQELTTGGVRDAHG
jgi:ribokinase